MQGDMTDIPEKIGDLAVVRTVAALRRAVALWRGAGESVALVPTMGALHAGHLALVAHGKARCTRVVASLFVNPTQFGPNEDFARYPRDEAGDAAKLFSTGCDLLYAPAADEIYPPGFASAVSPGPLGEILDGKFRPGHFGGVATVVMKLLLQAQADLACFGQKDYQQLQVVRRIVRDLDIPVRIEGVPTVRETDGLALSSRNAYLTPEQRRIAPQLHRVLMEIATRVGTGGQAPAEAASWGREELRRAGFDAVDYVAVCDAVSLQPLDRLDREARILGAAFLGRTRLIDNEALPFPADLRR
jgi:pantoate--beta-alanine ligase